MSLSRKRRSTAEPKAQSHFGDFFFDGSADTETLPLPDSMVQTSVEPCSTPRIAATAAGIVARTEPVSAIARETFDLKVPAIGAPITARGGRLFDFALTVGQIPICHGPYVGHRIGQRRQTQMALSNPRAQRGLKILADGDASVVRLTKRKYQVKSQSKDGYYDVENYDGAWSCTCPDFTESAQFCKHCWAVELSLKLRAAVEGDLLPEAKHVPLEQIPDCPTCGEKKAIRFGVRTCEKGQVQRFKCKACGKRFVTDNGFARLRVTPKAVVTAFDLWAKKVSYRQIAHHLKDIHGIEVGKSTIERWVRRMSELLTAYADKCKPEVGDFWHADETTVNINGNLRWTWNVMDHETRFWLASTLSETRAVADARKPLMHAKDVAGFRPAALVTDSLHSYNDAVRQELYTRADHTVHLIIPPLRSVPTDKDRGIHPGNNICERLQGTQRERTKVMRGFDLTPSAQGLINGYRSYYNLARPHIGLGGLTPAEKAGVPVPELSGEGRLMSVVVAAFREEQKRKRKARASA